MISFDVCAVVNSCRPATQLAHITSKPAWKCARVGLRTALFVISLIACSAAHAQDNRVSVEQDTDRVGSDYFAFTSNEPECRRRCAGDVRCKAYTFSRQSSRCSLKEEAPSPTSSAGLVSGVKGGWPDLSIVTVNMLGHTTCCNDGCYDDRACTAGPGTASANWSVRADRLADAIISLGPSRRPDIISLTEVEGWRWCSPGTGATVGDYDMIDRLSARLSGSTSVPYRVAYMVGNRGTFGVSEFCRYYSGDAVLYNSARLVNRNPEQAIGISTSRYDDARTGFQMRRSLPLCRPGSARMPTARNLIDGAPQSDDCNVAAPSGPAWTWIHQVPDMTSPITLVRFSFRHDLRSSFDFFTVHPPARHEERSRDEAIHPFIRRVTPLGFRRGLPFYPPILVGDVNSIANDIRGVAGFTETHNGTLMTVRRGDLAAFGALNDYRTLERRVLPENQASGFFSDHLGLYVRLGWANADDVVLQRSSDLSDGTTVGAESGGIWVIAGGAKFGIPNEDVHHRLYNGSMAITAPPADLSGVGKVPLDGTLLREENRKVWIIVGGAKFVVPDPLTLARLYPGARAVQVWDGALDEIRIVPRDGTLVREENGAISVIVGGAKFALPDFPTYSRFYPEGRPYPLWTGALVDVPTIPEEGTRLREESSATWFEVRDRRLRALPPAVSPGETRPTISILPPAAIRHPEFVLWEGALAQIPR
jgi:hypothetical protein